MWAKLDDGFPTHPKIVGLSDNAFRVHVIALCYSAQHLTDGYIPRDSVFCGNKTVTELLKSGLWERHPDGRGFAIHDYTDWNPSAADLRKRRAATRQRLAKWRARRPP